MCLYAKDLSIVRGIDVCELETVEEIIDNVPDEDEIK